LAFFLGKNLRSNNSDGRALERGERDSTPLPRCQANVAHIRQSRPDPGLGLQVKVLETFKGAPSKKEAECQETDADGENALLKNKAVAREFISTHLSSINLVQGNALHRTLIVRYI
jgi:hypothetical protein